MKILNTIADLQEALKVCRDKKIALVPTMGNLHKGHLRLVDIAKNHADVVVVSIFVNPTQFGVGEDFDNYPRTLDGDMTKLQTAHADFVFVPNTDEMYPTYPPSIQVLSGDVAKILCGQTRPTHFDGVGLVVGKLFNIVRPDVAVFGKKDYQQLAIIRQLNDELNFGIKIIGADIVRDSDGLALSSRNGYLTPSERNIAPRLNQILRQFADDLARHHKTMPWQKLTACYQDKLQQAGFDVDYLTVLTDKLTKPMPKDRHLVILVAVYLGKARLLDNLELTV